MPLHCISLFSSDFPNGDRGGCNFKITYPIENITNLHSLWDSCIGLFTKKMERPLKNEDRDLIERYANEIINLYPKDFFKEDLYLGEKKWVEESYNLAKDVVYKDIKPYDIPSKNYLDKSKEHAIKRLAEAGYRLAIILEDIFK